MKVWVQVLLVIGALVVCVMWVGDGSAEPAASAVDSVVLVRQIDGYGSGIIEFSPSGQKLGIVTHEGLAVLDPAEGLEIFAADFPIEACEITDQGCAFSGDGRYFAAGLNNALVVVDLWSGQLLISNEYPYDRSRWSMGALAFTPDGQHLLIGGQMPAVRVFDLVSGQVARSFGAGGVVGIKIMPDERTAAIARFVESDVLLWDWEHDTVVDTLTGCESWCPHLAATGTHLLAGCGGYTIQVWSSMTYEFLGLIKSHGLVGYGFSASDSASLLVSGSGSGNPDAPEGPTTSEIVLFDLNTLNAIYFWRAHAAGGIFDTAFSPDGTTLATSGYDGVLNIWRVVMK